TSGFLGTATTVVSFALLIVAVLLSSRLREATRVRRAIATALVLAILVALAERDRFLPTLIEILTFVLLARIASRRGSEDDASVAVLSLVGFIAASLVAP